MKRLQLNLFVLLLPFFIVNIGAAQDSQHNFTTNIELGPTAPITGGTEQISAIGTAGGGDDESDCGKAIYTESFYYNTSFKLLESKNFKIDEKVHITTISPEGKVVQENDITVAGSSDCAWITFSYLPHLNDL